MFSLRNLDQIDQIDQKIFLMFEFSTSDDISTVSLFVTGVTDMSQTCHTRVVSLSGGNIKTSTEKLKGPTQEKEMFE